MSAQEWRAAAACRGVDPNIFFPVRGEDTREAKAICAECPVRQACRDYAMTAGEAMGVWGALSARQRDALRGRRMNVSSTGLPGTARRPPNGTVATCAMDGCEVVFEVTAKRTRYCGPEHFATARAAYYAARDRRRAAERRTA